MTNPTPHDVALVERVAGILQVTSGVFIPASIARAIARAVIPIVRDAERDAVVAWLDNPTGAPFGKSPMYYAEDIRRNAHRKERT